MNKFNFNLLPKKSKELLEKEQKRDSYSVYYTFLVLFGVVLWFGLVVFNTFIVDRSVDELQQKNKKKEDRINSEFMETRRIHGELVMKTKSIAPLLENDIDPEAVFQVAQDVFPINEGDVSIVGYGRNKDGTFTISIVASNYQTISRKARSLRNLDIVNKLEVDKVAYTPLRNQYLADFNFSIDKSALE